MSRRIYFLTVHVPTEDWAEIQSKYLRRNVKNGFVLAVLPKLRTEPFFDHEFMWLNRNLRDRDFARCHIENLDRLTDYLFGQGPGDGDVIVSLDGDAFPIKPLDEQLFTWLEQYPVVSIERSAKWKTPKRRLPHPAFLATTIKFFRKHFLSLGWGKVPVRGGYFDTAGRICRKIIKEKIPYLSLGRSNTIEPFHPYFGVHGGVIYHHGWGFRPLRLMNVEQAAGWTLEKKREVMTKVFERLKADPLFYRDLGIDETSEEKKGRFR